ncbi:MULTISPECIES: protein kinase [unclassified Streptomyces]|uniref:protein kinase domain-containing protein n=1 Tax=unclassified Streptomyces TaxID=2593676 RepID=UPI00368FB766
MTTQPLSTGDPIRLGPYRLLGVLGEGGMGKVYVGRDATGTPAAVKVLRPELAHDQHLAQRFVREADMARAVTGEGVARILGARTDGGRLWIAAEFLAGPTLDEAVHAYGPMDAPTVRSLAAHLARTLHDIHAAGLVHRDLKPANIVLTSTGPRIIDFGIARPEHGLTLTTTGQIPVTPGYGAPEQVLGQRVGPASDVFSLGAVLAYAASGRRTFDGAHVAAVQYEVVHGAPDLSLVPPELRDLIAPCLAKDPQLRPSPAQVATAFAPPKGADRTWLKGPLADDIKRREEHVRGLAAPEATPVSTITPSRRRFLTGTAVGVAALGAGTGAGAWWLGRRDGKRPTEGKAPAFEVPPAVATPQAAFISVTDSRPGEAPRPLWGPVDVTAADGAPPLPVRDVLVVHMRKIGLLALSVTTGKERWRAREADPRAGLVSVAGRLVVGADPHGTLHAYVASTGRPVWQTEADARTVLAADDTQVYVVTGDNQLRALDAWTLRTRWTRPMPSPHSPEGPAKAAVGRKRLVIHGRDGVVSALDTDTGKAVWDTTGQGTDGQAPGMGADVVYLGGPELTAWRLDHGEYLWAQEAFNLASRNRWGTPVADGELVFVMDNGLARRYRTAQEVKMPLSDWYVLLDSFGARMTTVTAPAVEGATVWLPEPDGSGIQVVHRTTAEKLFTLKMEREGPYQLVSDGNRVFVTRGGRVAAFPVLGI